MTNDLKDDPGADCELARDSLNIDAIMNKRSESMENQNAANDQSIDRKYFDEESNNNRLSYELTYDLVEKDTAEINGMRNRIESQDSAVNEILEGIDNKRSVNTAV